MREEAGSFAGLLSIMDRLRREGGCPWDREQTRHSLKPFLIEEAYEVIEAIESGDPEKIKEELGDLLFQIIFHAKISEELGEFDIEDIIKTTTGKMIKRHPHVFAEKKVKNAKEVLIQWEEIKQEENKRSILEGVPGQLPSLLRAHRLQDRASRVGFDWENAGQVQGKVAEEWEEFSK
jgi:tetrapyrrole methylase family protein/MazG family protein